MKYTAEMTKYAQAKVFQKIFFGNTYTRIHFIPIRFLFYPIAVFVPTFTLDARIFLKERGGVVVVINAQKIFSMG